ncbi:MAG: SPFH domain-containing protein [Erysipelotrichaceae bacterium]|jgi:hypothetical protein|nr:SPFH domain-containing protein [Erysipelotrichaceae bacterium]
MLELWITITIIVIVIIIFAAFFLFLSSLVIVKKDHQAIIEKYGAFERILEPGRYFLNPFTTRRAGYYQVKNIVFKHLFGDTLFAIHYEIEDIVKFHYQKTNLTNLVSTWFQSGATDDDIKSKLTKYGITVLGIKH